GRPPLRHRLIPGPGGGPAGRPGAGESDRDREGGDEPGLPVAGDRGQLMAVAVAEDVVGGERDVVEVADALPVAVRLVGVPAGRGWDLGVALWGAGSGGVPLEGDARPGPAVGAWEDAGELPDPAGAGRLHAPQVVLRLVGVERVLAAPIAVPDIDGRAGEGPA